MGTCYSFLTKYQCTLNGNDGGISEILIYHLLWNPQYIHGIQVTGYFLYHCFSFFLCRTRILGSHLRLYWQAHVHVHLLNSVSGVQDIKPNQGFNRHHHPGLRHQCGFRLHQINFLLQQINFLPLQNYFHLKHIAFLLHHQIDYRRHAQDIKLHHKFHHQKLQLQTRLISVDFLKFLFI